MSPISSFLLHILLFNASLYLVNLMAFSSSTYPKFTITSSSPPFPCFLSTCIPHLCKCLLTDFLAFGSSLSNSVCILLLQRLFKNAAISMSSRKILQWFCIAFRIKSKFYKVFKIIHFPIRALISAISEYL